MQDNKLILYHGYSYTKYSMPGPTTATVSADTNPTHSAGSTGSFIQLLDTNRIPQRGMALEYQFPGPFTPSGTSGTATLVFTVTFSTDGTNALANLSHVSRPIVFTAATGPTATVTTPNTFPTGLTSYSFFQRLPKTVNTASLTGSLYIKVSWATTLATLTTMDYGPLTIALVQEPDSDYPGAADIG